MDNQSQSPVFGVTYQGILGAVVNILRSDSGRAITQAEIAEQLGITVSTWSRIERGESPLTLEQLLMVASFLGLPLSSLFKFVEEKVDELAKKGIQVAISKEALQEIKALPLSSGQLVAMSIVPGGIGIIGAAAYGLYKSLIKSKNKS